MPPKDNHVDALEAMASGEDIAQSAEVETQEHEPQSDTEAASHQSAEPVPFDSPVAQTSPAAAAEARRARQAKLKRAAAANTALHFKKTLTPLLLVAGILLILMGGAVLLMVGDRSAGGLSSGAIKALCFSAFPLGALLIAGAWWMHRDTRSTEDG